MTKTAEEILKDNVHLATTETLHSMKGNIIEAMHEFAAQEGEAFKKRLKNEFAQEWSPDDNLDTSICIKINQIIDAVK